MFKEKQESALEKQETSSAKQLSLFLVFVFSLFF